MLGQETTNKPGEGTLTKRRLLKRGEWPGPGLKSKSISILMYFNQEV
jgi:hypothetical protein